MAVATREHVNCVADKTTTFPNSEELGKWSGTARQDKAMEGKTRQGRTRHGNAREGEARARLGEAGQGKEWQGRARPVKANEERVMQD